MMEYMRTVWEQEEDCQGHVGINSWVQTRSHLTDSEQHGTAMFNLGSGPSVQHLTSEAIK